MYIKVIPWLLQLIFKVIALFRRSVKSNKWPVEILRSELRTTNQGPGTKDQEPRTILRETWKVRSKTNLVPRTLNLEQLSVTSNA